MPQLSQYAFRFSAGLLPVLVLAACASSGDTSRAAQCSDCGEITSIAQRPAGATDPRGQFLSDSINNAGGGLSELQLRSLDQASVGGLLGTGRAARGADLGSAIPRTASVFEVLVDMDTGPDERVLVGSLAGIRIGKRVRVVGDRLLPAPAARD